ncbi:MAG: hypothetical protein ACI898_002290, partial [Flavobacteriales bacterium]
NETLPECSCLHWNGGVGVYASKGSFTIIVECAINFFIFEGLDI